MNDNDKAPGHIKKLLGKKVWVRQEKSGGYKGTLLSYHEGPVIVLHNARYMGTGGGLPEGDKVFPADCQMDESPDPPPPEPCPHCGQTPFRNIIWGLREVCGEIREDPGTCL